MTRFAPFALLALTTGCSPASRHLFHGAGDAVSRMLLLFVLGTVLVALVTARMEKLELEVAARPMHSFAVGLVGMLVTAAGLVILCVTVVGIPVAAIAAMVLILAGYSGVCAVLVTVGGALIRHRTDNPYLHLALGCVLLLVVESIGSSPGRAGRRATRPCCRASPWPDLTRPWRSSATRCARCRCR